MQNRIYLKKELKIYLKKELRIYFMWNVSLRLSRFKISQTIGLPACQGSSQVQFLTRIQFCFVSFYYNPLFQIFRCLLRFRKQCFSIYFIFKNFKTFYYNLWNCGQLPEICMHMFSMQQRATLTGVL